VDWVRVIEITLAILLAEIVTLAVRAMRRKAARKPEAA